MPGSNMNVRLDACPSQTWFGAGARISDFLFDLKDFDISSSGHVGLPFRGAVPNHITIVSIIVLSA